MMGGEGRTVGRYAAVVVGRERECNACYVVRWTDAGLERKMWMGKGVSRLRTGPVRSRRDGMEEVERWSEILDEWRIGIWRLARILPTQMLFAKSRSSSLSNLSLCLMSQPSPA